MIPSDQVSWKQSFTFQMELIPTGGGKSVIYTVPAVIKEGLTMVIEPLKFIMKEQTKKRRRIMFLLFT